MKWIYMSNKIGVSSEFCLTFIQNARFRRTTELSLLREENLALLNIINDFDTRLATVEAERDELKKRIDGYHCTARNTRIVDIRELDLVAHKVIL